MHICVTWLIHVFVTWLIHMFVIWLICMRNMTHIPVSDRLNPVWWIMSHIGMSHESHFEDSWVAYKWGTSHMHRCHTSRTRMPWHDSIMYVWNDSFMYLWHESSIRETWLIHVCDMTHPCVWHDSYTGVRQAGSRCGVFRSWRAPTYYCGWPPGAPISHSWLIHTWGTWLVHMYIYMWDMTRSCTRVFQICKPPTYYCCRPPGLTSIIRDSFVCRTWLVHMRDMTHSYVRQDSFISETWLVHMWDMTRSYTHVFPRSWAPAYYCGWPPGAPISHSWLICDSFVLYSYVEDDLFVRETWLVRRLMYFLRLVDSCISFVLHLYMENDLFICETGLVRDSCISFDRLMYFKRSTWVDEFANEISFKFYLTDSCRTFIWYARVFLFDSLMYFKWNSWVHELANSFHLMKYHLNFIW